MRGIRCWLGLAATCWATCATALDLTFSLPAAYRQDQLVGTIFEASAEGVRCAAGFVDAVQSRVYTNQHDLEFWCREGEGEPLKFESIGKPYEGQFTSSIANLKGRLYEFVGKSIYEDGRWRPLQLGDLGAPLDALPISVQEREGETFTFTIYGERCEGISIYSTKGYHGTYRGADWQQWSAVWTDGRRLVLNVGYKIKVGDLPPPSSASCSVIEVVDSNGEGGSDWVYAMIGLEPGLLYGGSELQRLRCAKLQMLDLTSAKSSAIRLADCLPGFVSEIYAFTRWRDEVLIGNFPLGTLIALAPDKGVTRITKFAMPRLDDLPDPAWGGGPYRESQSVVVSAGRVYVGMFPWAELFVQDSEDSESVIFRFFATPEKGREVAPFSTRLLAASAEVPSIPYFDRRWGQRIPSIVVLSGRVCASTGNLSGHNLAEWGKVIAEHEAQPYGQIFCAHLSGHTLGRVEAKTGRIRFQLAERTLSIHLDGRPIAEALHGLSAAALQKLKGAIVRTGKGDYGPLKVKLEQLGPPAK